MIQTHLGHWMGFDMIVSSLLLLMFQLYVLTSGRDSYSLCSAPFLHAVVRWKGLVEMEMCCFELHFCDKTLPFSKTEFRLKIPRGLSFCLMRIPVHGRVKKPWIYESWSGAKPKWSLYSRDQVVARDALLLCPLWSDRVWSHYPGKLLFFE